MNRSWFQDQDIYGVELYYPQQFRDARGCVRRMCRIDDPYIGLYGMEEIYFSTVYPGVVKAWHLHKEIWLRYACVYGKVWVGLYDDREDSPTKGNSMFCLLDDWGQNYVVLVIPPFVWNGFRSDSSWKDISIIANCASKPHHPDEIVRMSIEDAPFDFDWGDYDMAG